MPCEVVPLRVDFFKNGCRNGMETTKMLKKIKEDVYFVLII
jgi:hypothetical protein